MSYPTLATGTIVERKGDDATDRRSHLVIDHGNPEEKPEKVEEPKDEVAETVTEEVSGLADDDAG